MTGKICTVLLAAVLFLASCGNVAPSVPTPTLRPSRSPSPASTNAPRPTASPSPTPTLSRVSSHNATVSAFETLLAGTCPTGTAIPEETGGATAWSDAALLGEFAGDYSHSTGFWNYYLVVGCDNTFHELIITDTLQYMSFEGSIAVLNRQIVLIGKRDDGISHTAVFVPVRWGARKYLIESDRLTDFCADIKSTSRFKEPRAENGIGFFYLRVGDNKIEVTGGPTSLAGNEICR